MPELGTFGSVRGVPGNGHSYRDQFFSGMQYYEPRLPCDATQIGRFRRVLGEAGVEQLLKSTIEAAVAMKAVKKAELEMVIVDITVQEGAIAFPTDSRLLEVGSRASQDRAVGQARRAQAAPDL
jgi:IS5 family transposase